MQAIFLDQQTFGSAIDLSPIQSQCQVTCYPLTAINQIVERCHNAQIIITNKVNLSKATLTALPHLKLICIAATGYNNVDIQTAKALGITVCNVSGYSNASVSQYVFAQLLEYFSNIHAHNKNTAHGLWQKSDTFCYLGSAVHELAGKKLGIIGYGSLGKTIKKIAEAFSMEVLIAERQNSETIRPERLAFEYVLKNADIISLHCPQTPETTNMVNAQFLSYMKKSAVLINTARGPLVDNQALLNSLINKEISCAILDVLDSEPPASDHPLLNTTLDNLKITAHIAWASVEAQQRLINLIANNISAFKRGTPQNCVT